MTAQAQSQVVTATPETAGTDYVVLYDATSELETDYWSIYGTFKASNDKQAIRLAIQDGLAGDRPAYVAVPARSWQVRQPTVDTKPTVKF